ncbi:HXXEE domain-containing protein [Corynebacterium silvaticum]|uniref:HXXEE domain-containing protein n=1 Tax=Corynebacterium silvaticum TaxID=2320431 RepID=A0A7Y4P9L2_9CORY|nr:HXXEE domain-containing protein [Corynebacterium silvaticum]ARU45703.1 HXXEE domain-containing protein [Corynebacterium silvaticum]MBH5299888.1 HXXEE domain-containing protein [Corynebacterium silvaticum]NOM65778.1 HXXEE domain-containing protein [Corynebacterium silvaticum]NON70335.1 HXXEE domain-containing protein [Corynebacterium silvaticum]TFA91589.1 HXXEE domain-containing protein [Corynebacterium silvaticum]
MEWTVIAFLFLFIWHEIEEFFVLVPWLRRNSAQLPGIAGRRSMSLAQAVFIASEELIVLIVICLWAEDVWVLAAMIAYTIHLVIHCAQMVYTYIKRFPLRLWSAPLQLPIMAWLIIAHPSQGAISLPVASTITVAVMCMNLAFMHWFTNKVLSRSFLPMQSGIIATNLRNQPPET